MRRERAYLGTAGVAMAMLACAPSGAVRGPASEAKPNTRIETPTDADAEESPTEAQRAPAPLCDDASFWDGAQCLPKREALTNDTLSRAMGSCRRSDDQLCPLELELYQHDCDLGEASVCERLESLKTEWLNSKTEAWATERCALGQWAACLVAGEKYYRSCERTEDDAAAIACSKFVELCEQVPDLAGTVDVSVRAVKERACELGHADSCYRGPVEGLGIGP